MYIFKVFFFINSRIRFSSRSVNIRWRCMYDTGIEIFSDNLENLNGEAWWHDVDVKNKVIDLKMCHFIAFVEFRRKVRNGKIYWICHSSIRIYKKGCMHRDLTRYFTSKILPKHWKIDTSWLVNIEGERNRGPQWLYRLIY